MYAFPHDIAPWTPTATLEELMPLLDYPSTVLEHNSWSIPASYQQLPYCSTVLQYYCENSPNCNFIYYYSGTVEYFCILIFLSIVDIFPICLGQKVGILLEELGLHYNAFKSNSFDLVNYGFLESSPQGKLPALIIRNEKPNCIGTAESMHNVKLFGSGAIMMYLVETYYSALLSTDPIMQRNCHNWFHWQISVQDSICSQFMHFMNEVPGGLHEAKTYGVVHYGREVQRMFALMDDHFSKQPYLLGELYSVADIACFPWIHFLFSHPHHVSSVIDISYFLGTYKYRHLYSWWERIFSRPEVQRGLLVYVNAGPMPTIDSNSAEEIEGSEELIH